jgi:single-strand DNA-binding protein
MRVMVTGELRQRSYETREGEKRTVLEVEASEVAASFLYATAKVQRVGRSSGSAGSSSSRRPAPDDDPWGNAPQPTGDDEPPF